MEVKNKIDGYKKRIELNLNRFPEESFYINQKDKVIEFINKYDADYYAVRSLDIIGYKSNIKVPKKLVIEEIEKYNIFTISVSSHNYGDDLILIGDIRIDRDNSVWILASQNEYPKLSNKFPDFNFCTDIFDKKLNHIPGFDVIYGYLINNNLLDIIVEFAVYNKSVGINNEQVVIFELRTDY